MTTEPATKIKYRIGGMDCASCVSKIENAVSRLPGVEEVGVSLASASMTVRPGPDFAKSAVERQVKALGYAITADDDAAGSPGETGASHADLGEGPWWKTKKAILTATTGAALALTYIAHLIFPAVPQWIFVPALAVGLIPVARRAVVAATTGTPFSIEMLMTIAAVGALFIGAAEEAVAVVFLFLVGELLEGVAARPKHRLNGTTMRNLIASLLFLLPTATLAHEFKAGSLLIDHPKVIETPPGAKVAAGYLTVVNEGEADDRLVAIESTAIARIEMHSSQIVDGIASMKPMENGLALPAGKTVGLGEDGTHAMFMDLTKQLKEGEKIEAVLVFEKAGRVPVVFNVEKRSAQKNERHEHQQ